jgi:hypothetical protein
MRMQLPPGGTTPRSIIRTPRGRPDGGASVSGMLPPGGTIPRSIIRTPRGRPDGGASVSGMRPR